MYQYLSFKSPPYLSMNIAFFTKTWPRRSISAPLETTIGLIESLVNLNHQIVVCSDEQNIQLKQQLKQYPMELLDINSKKISNSLNGLTKSGFKPNMFIFDSVETEEKYSAFIYNRWNKCPRVLAINQLSGLSKWRKNNYKQIPHVLIPHQFPMNPQKTQQIFTQSQIRSIVRSDYIFSSNQYTYHVLCKYMFGNTQNKSKHISQINLGYPMDQYYGEVASFRYRPFANRQNFVFFGNMENQSNRDCIYILGKIIWPLIKKQIPTAQLHIYGQGGAFYQNIFKKSQDKQLSKENMKKMDIVFKGIMKEPEKLSQYRALLYPCVFSTGSHIKVLQSWFEHLPVVTTPIGAEGLFLQNVDPQFSSPMDPKRGSGFSSERIFTKEQKQLSQKANEYYQNNIITSKNINKLTFGGSCNSLTYNQFAQNSVKLYNNEAYWKQCLSKGQDIIKKNQNDTHLETVIKKAMIKVEMAAYEGKSRQNYIQEWRRYSRSQQFAKKIRA